MNTRWVGAGLMLLSSQGCRQIGDSAAESVLVEQLNHGVEWKRVHAAEALCESGTELDAVRTALAGELASSRPETPWRVGMLRVAALSDPARRAACREELLTIARNPKSEGRIHAVETIGKLRLPVEPSDMVWLRQCADDPGILGGYALLVLAQAGEPEARPALERRLEGGDTTAAFAFFYLDGLPPETEERLARAAERMEAPPQFRAFAFRALARARGNKEPEHRLLRQRIETETDPGALRFYLLSAGPFRQPGDREMLTAFLSHTDPALRIAAAASILVSHQR